MQPLVLTFPDSVRDRLEAVLAPLALTRPLSTTEEKHALTEAVAHIIGDVHPPEADRAFLGQLRDAVLGLGDGSGSPAIMLANLPPSNAKLMLGMASLLGESNGVNTLSGINEQRIHRDESQQERRKPIEFFLCQSAGTYRQPTNIVSADEVIVELAREKHLTEEAVVARLAAITIAEAGKEQVPFLWRNPNAKPGSGAVTYLTVHQEDYNFDLTHTEYNKPLTANDSEWYNDFAAAAERCAKRGNVHDIGTTQANTLLIWNDDLIYHKRGAALTQHATEGTSRTVDYTQALGYHHPDNQKPFTHGIQPFASEVTRLVASDAPRVPAR